MKKIPFTDDTVVLRTDYSDESAWDSICDAIQQDYGGFRAYVEFVNDRAFDGITPEEALSLLDPSDDGATRSFFFIVDKMSLTHAEQPVLVIDLVNALGRTFRVIPSMMWSVENNLSIANMDFAEFADEVDSDGIFRDFPD